MRHDRTTPGSQTSLREANRARIVTAVQQRGSLTQVELAGVTGLSPATVSNIVKELTSSGVLHTAPTSRSGRRAQQVTLARNLGLVAGVHFGTRSMRIALADTAHRIVAEQRMPLAPDHRGDSGLDRAGLLLAELVEQVDASMSEVLGVGVGVPAPVDPRTGRVSAVGLLRGWQNVSAPERLSEQLGVPVHVDNDANLGALAEARAGAGRGYEDVAYVRVSHGVGAGLVVGGAVVHGRTGAVGEIGHLPVDDDGPPCRCGRRGCLELYAGSAAVLAALQPSHGNISLKEALALAAAGDVASGAALAVAGDRLGRGVAMLCTLVDPQVVVIGGPLAAGGELLLAQLRTALARGTGRSTVGPVPVVTSELGDQAEVRGALLLAIDRAQIAGAPVPDPGAHGSQSRGGPSHAGPSHAGPTDAGPTDAGPTDAGPTDAGQTHDGGRP